MHHFQKTRHSGMPTSRRVQPRDSTEMPNPKPIRYAEYIQPQDTQRALETVKVSLFPNETKPVAIDFEGRCPRCGDPIRSREWLVVVAGALKLNNKQMEDLAARHFCGGSCKRAARANRLPFRA
jgi:hypothetical protein